MIGVFTIYCKKINLYKSIYKCKDYVVIYYQKCYKKYEQLLKKIRMSSIPDIIDNVTELKDKNLPEHKNPTNSEESNLKIKNNKNNVLFN